MGVLKFNGKEVARCIDHASHSKECRLAYGEKKAVPALHLVHDQGVYIMSNGLPADKKHVRKKSGRCFVSYANGCHPKKNEFWWETSRDLAGGDDFVDSIPLSDFKATDIEDLRSDRADLNIELTETQLRIVLVMKGAGRETQRKAAVAPQGQAT
jgi:hypothetical protein